MVNYKVTKVRKAAVPPEEMVELVGRLHRAYGFRMESYRFVGIDDDVLRSAGLLTVEGKRTRPRKRAA